MVRNEPQRAATVNSIPLVPWTPRPLRGHQLRKKPPKSRLGPNPMPVTDEPFVSVVTPFYDTADYLRQCIESVLAQSHGNFEYVLMDNQSKDGSTDIAKEYASRDSRIRYFRTDRFLTQIQNYNHTIAQVSPKARYCKIVQADDWIFVDCL